MLFGKRFITSVAQRGKYRLFLRPQGSLPELELRYLQCTCCWRSRIPVTGFETLNASLSSSGTPCKDEDQVGQPLDTCYTPEQRDAILLVLNTATEAELGGVKLLRGRKSQNIVEYRIRNGPFKNLASVINVPLLKHKSAVVVFDSILNPPKKEVKKAKLQFARFIRPEVEKSSLLEANSIVSIVCGLNKIAWAHVDRQKTVLDWQEQECPNFMTGTYMASSYLEDISSVVSHLPSTDFFVVEKPSISLQNTTLFPIMAHMRTVEAMLFSLLEPRYARPPPALDPDAPPRVLNMMRVPVGRHFDLIVGDSRSSGAQAVRRMMSESATQKVPRVSFPHRLLLKYRNAFQLTGRRNSGEELCDALLQAVAFYELLGKSN